MRLDVYFSSRWGALQTFQLILVRISQTGHPHQFSRIGTLLASLRISALAQRMLHIRVGDEYAVPVIFQRYQSSLERAAVQQQSVPRDACSGHQLIHYATRHVRERVFCSLAGESLRIDTVAK